MASGPDMEGNDDQKEEPTMAVKCRDWGCTPATVGTIFVACLLAAAISLVGGVYMWQQSLKTLDTSIEETSFADIEYVSGQLNDSVLACQKSVDAMLSMFYHTDAALQSCTRDTAGAEQAKAWDTVLRWWQFSRVVSSPSVQEMGYILLPYRLDDPNLHYTHIWYDLKADGTREYVHARYGSHLSAHPGPGGDPEDWEGRNVGYYQAPGTVNGHPDFHDGVGGSPTSWETPPKWHVARTDVINETTGQHIRWAYDFAVTKWNSPNLVENRTGFRSVGEWEAGYEPVGWKRGPEPAVMHRWRDPQVWYASDSNPYIFTAYDLVMAPPQAPHPWSGYRAILAQGYFVFAGWSDVIMTYARESESRSSYAAPVIVLYDLRTHVVYASTNGDRLVNSSLRGAREAGTDPVPEQYFVKLSSLASHFGAGAALVNTSQCNRAGSCFVQGDCGGFGDCYARRKDLFAFTGKGKPSAIDASLLWLRAKAEIEEETNEALTLIIIMVVAVVVLSACVAFYEAITRSSFVGALVAAWRVQDSTTQDAVDNARQLGFWKDAGLEELLIEKHTDPIDWVEQKVKENPQFIHIRDPVGASLLHWTVLQGCLGNTTAMTIAEHLLDAYPEVINQEYQRPMSEDEEKWELGKYDGEAALHLAVVLGHVGFTTKLLHRGASPFARTYGSFFAPGREWTPTDKAHTYFGEYALSFAVGMGNGTMCQVLLERARTDLGEAGSSDSRRRLLRAQDSFGNTALHIAVLHRQLEMFTLLLGELRAAVEEISDDAPDLEVATALHVRGAQGLTPLGLATVLGDHATFEHLIEAMLSLRWKFGRVRCCQINLDQIDTVPLPTATRHRSVLNLIHLWNILPLATDTMVVRLMDAKWERVRPFFYISLLFHCVFLCMLVLLATEYIDVQQRPGTEIDTLVSYETYVASWCAVLVLVTLTDLAGGIRDLKRQMLAMLRDVWTFLVGEEEQPKETGPRRKGDTNEYGGVPKPPAEPEDFKKGNDEKWEDWWRCHVRSCDVHFLPGKRRLMNTVPMSDWSVLSWAGQLLLLAHLISYSADGFGRNASVLTSALLGIGVLSFFLSTLQYTMASQGLDTLVNIIIRCVIRDVRDFAFIYSFFLVGFGIALYVTLVHIDVFNDVHKPTATEWDTLGWGLDILLRRTMGEIGGDRNWWIGESGAWPYFPYWLMCLWTILGLVILLNLLISMFSSTYSKVREEALQQFRISKGRRIILLERRIRFFGDQLHSYLRINHAAEKDKNHIFIFEEDTEAPPPIVQEVEAAAVQAEVRRKSMAPKELQATLSNLRRDSATPPISREPSALGRPLSAPRRFSEAGSAVSDPDAVRHAQE
eukprot:TRINITY_DN50387_c0_g1_i1.p1 TRINITY_DN50387_c0_g1~~TRINITY_DN50387_c0_g1_i1.p1  ORF type:complete len:1341 (+),score=386.01 TRINITY_DN50387_c0_g1_i1:125-4147(+)